MDPVHMGVARIFQREGHTDSYIGYSPNCHLNIVGCLLTKRLTKGGSRAPQDPPWLRPWSIYFDEPGPLTWSTEGTDLKATVILSF